MRQALCAVFLLGATMLANAADLAVLRNGFSIRHERREQMGTTVRLFLSATTDSGYVDVPADQIASYRHDDSPAPVASPTRSQACKGHPCETGMEPMSREQLRDLIASASDKHQVDEDLLASVIRAESNFNARAVSPKGAQGLMQLMPGTAAKLGVGNAFQPEANVDAGTRYLRDLLVRYHDDIAKALAAYNAGPQRVEQYHGVPPYRETRAYVASIIRDFNRKKLAERKHVAQLKRAAARVRTAAVPAEAENRRAAATTTATSD